MPGQNWTTPDQFDFLTDRFPDYTAAQTSGRFDKFWNPLTHKWFQNWPEPQPAVPAELINSAPETSLEALQERVLGEAIVRRKAVCSSHIMLKDSSECFLIANQDLVSVPGQPKCSQV
jgi:hypothetical protein